MADRDPHFGRANKTSQRDCLRYKSAGPLLLRWRRSAVPPCKASPLGGSSGSLNFRFLRERRSQLNERDARVAKLRAAIHAFDYQLNFVDRLGVVSDADEVRTFEVLIGNALRKRVLFI